MITSARLRDLSAAILVIATSVAGCSAGGSAPPEPPAADHASIAAGPSSTSRSSKAPLMDNATAAARWKTMQVGDVLRDCGVTYASIDFIDEPPGKLRALALRCGDRDVILAVNYVSALFSDQRTWPEAIVREQPVAGVFWSRAEYDRGAP